MKLEIRLKKENSLLGRKIKLEVNEVAKVHSNILEIYVLDTIKIPKTLEKYVVEDGALHVIANVIPIDIPFNEIGYLMIK